MRHEIQDVRKPVPSLFPRTIRSLSDVSPHSPGSLANNLCISTDPYLVALYPRPEIPPASF